MKQNTYLDRAYEDMGKYNEKYYTEDIKKSLGNVVKSDFKYDTTDFYGVNYMLELKSRTCASTDFKETMFGFNKRSEEHSLNSSH